VTEVPTWEELAVSGGQLVTTATVVVAVPTLVNPAGQTGELVDTCPPGAAMRGSRASLPFE